MAAITSVGTGPSANASNNPITLGVAPAITSANATTFTTGSAGKLHRDHHGQPDPGLTKTGSLPSGVTFVDNGNGTATLSGTPATSGSYPITITANNGIGSPATQSFTLTVDAAPAITSASSTTFTVGSAGTFTVTTTGNPDPGPVGERDPAQRGDLRRQRQRDGHPVRHAGGRYRRELPVHHHGHQRRGQSRPPSPSP